MHNVNHTHLFECSEDEGVTLFMMYFLASITLQNDVLYG